MSQSVQGTSQSVQETAAAIRAELGKVIVGQGRVVEEVLAALLAGGHVLLEGVPGLGKTLLVKTLARTLRAQFRRIQFTPDLMPSDVLGTNVLDVASGTFRVKQGPVFTNLLLADEINRTPPKTQAALLEAMEEGQVTLDGVAHPLPDPFLVVATQNPVEYEGTYPLPEAQLDRFLLKIDMGYPTAGEERELLSRFQAGRLPADLEAAGVAPVADAAVLAGCRRTVREVAVSEPVLGYLNDLIRATRESPLLSLGASPRASLALLAAAKAMAALAGRDFLTPDDVKSMACPVLRHRILTRPEAEVEGVTPDQAIAGILETLPVPR